MATSKKTVETSVADGVAVVAPAVEVVEVEAAEDEKPCKRMSRPQRFAQAMSLVDEAHGELEALREELQNWLDNLPENLQGGGKASELEEAIEGLDTIVNSLEETEGNDVAFPRMFG